jgi:hypothetical protein
MMADAAKRLRGNTTLESLALEYPERSQGATAAELTFLQKYKYVDVMSFDGRSRS